MQHTQIIYFKPHIKIINKLLRTDYHPTWVAILLLLGLLRPVYGAFKEGDNFLNIHVKFGISSGTTRHGFFLHTKRIVELKLSKAYLSIKRYGAAKN